MPSDIEIAQKAKMQKISNIAKERLGIHEDDLENYGRYKAKVSFSFLDKLFKPTCSFVSRTLPTKWEIGYNGLKLDFGQIIVFALLLIIYRSI